MGYFGNSLLFLLVVAGSLHAAPENGVELISYCTNWSGECKALAAELEKLSNTKRDVLAKHGITIKQVDADKEPNTILSERITTYPTLRLHAEYFDSTFDNKLEYTSEGIFNFLSRSVIHPILESSSWQADVKTFTSRGYNVYVYRGPVDAKDKNSPFSLFKTTAGILANALHTIYIYEKDSAETKASLQMFTPSDIDSSFKHSWTLQNLLSFASVLPKQPIVSCLSNDDMSPIFDKEYTAIIMFVDKQVPEDLLAEFKALAKKPKQRRRVYALCDASDKEAHDLYLSYFGFTKFPTVGILDHYKHELLKYQLNGQTAEELRNQFESYENKNLPLFYKSQEVPTTKSGIVTTLVGSNYEATVKDKSVNFLILVTSTVNCNKCAEAEATFGLIAERYQKDHRIRFGKIDIAHNDIPHLADPELPGVLLYIKGEDRTPVHLLKKISDKNLSAFLRKHTNLPA